jgi:hypothetical protein
MIALYLLAFFLLAQSNIASSETVLLVVTALFTRLVLVPRFHQYLYMNNSFTGGTFALATLLLFWFLHSDLLLFITGLSVLIPLCLFLLLQKGFSVTSFIFRGTAISLTCLFLAIVTNNNNSFFNEDFFQQVMTGMATNNRYYVLPARILSIIALLPVKALSDKYAMIVTVFFDLSLFLICGIIIPDLSTPNQLKNTIYSRTNVSCLSTIVTLLLLHYSFAAILLPIIISFTYFIYSTQKQRSVYHENRLSLL